MKSSIQGMSGSENPPEEKPKVQDPLKIIYKSTLTSDQVENFLSLIRKRSPSPIGAKWKSSLDIMTQVISGFK